MARGLLLGVAGTALVAWLTLRWFTVSKVALNPEEHVLGKNVLLTGASSGIGRQMALQLCAMGANLFVTARREELLKQVLEECRTVAPSGSRHGYHLADMSVMDQAEAVIPAAVSFLGGLDYLFLNHGYLPSVATFYQMNDEGFSQLQKTMNVNFFSYVKMLQAAMPHLVKSHGRIGVTSSDSGEIPHPLAIDYVASKYAINGFFGGLDLDFYTRNTEVSVTICIVGPVDTVMMNNFFEGISKQEAAREAMSMGSAPECAAEIVRATAVRETVTYFPTDDFWLWAGSIYNKLFPQDFRDSIKEIYTVS